MSFVESIKMDVDVLFHNPSRRTGGEEELTEESETQVLSSEPTPTRTPNRRIQRPRATQRATKKTMSTKRSRNKKGTY